MPLIPALFNQQQAPGPGRSNRLVTATATAATVSLLAGVVSVTKFTNFCPNLNRLTICVQQSRGFSSFANCLLQYQQTFWSASGTTASTESLLTSKSAQTNNFAQQKQQSAQFFTRMSSPQAPAVIQPTKQHTATVIFLHGLGDTGNGWSPVFQNMIRSAHIKAICPHAPTRPVTINMGMQMPAWFDINGLSIDSKEDEAGIKDSAKQVHSMLDAEIAAGIPSDRIMLGGFSMGGALALYSALTYNKKLAGIVALSSFIVLRDQIPSSDTPNREIPVFQGHGDVDPLVALPFAQATHKIIKEFNPNASFKLYSGMGHSACDQELKDIKEFLDKYLPSK